MNIFKLITSLVLTILPAIVLIRDWKFQDKRTIKHHKITRAIIVLWFIGSISATYFVWSDSALIRELVNGKDTLIQQNQDLAGKIDDYQKNLDEKDKIIQELQEKVKKAEKGITLTYDFNGAKRETTRPGDFSLKFGSEFEVFKKIQELEEKKHYGELVTICEKQIKETPEWLTPYLYLGIALANLGYKDRAIDIFEYVKENSFGDPKYSHVSEFLEKLKSQ